MAAFVELGRLIDTDVLTISLKGVERPFSQPGSAQLLSKHLGGMKMKKHHRWYPCYFVPIMTSLSDIHLHLLTIRR